MEQELENAKNLNNNMMENKISLIKNIMNKYSFKNFKVIYSMIEFDRNDFSTENP